MTNYSAKTVDEFIDAAPVIARPHLEALRKLVLSAVPGAEEGIHYGKPYYKYHGYLAGFDTYKHHIGLELWTEQLNTEDREILESMGYKTGSRTFQIRYDQQIPTEITERLLKEQARLNKVKTETH